MIQLKCLNSKIQKFPNKADYIEKELLQSKYLWGLREILSATKPQQTTMECKQQTANRAIWKDSEGGFNETDETCKINIKSEYMQPQEDI